MKTKSCGCSTATCGCCEGTQAVTPQTIYNRPGLDALDYRVGTYGTFFETMKALLGNMPITVTAADGVTTSTIFPLTGLTTRDASDPGIALMDAWSVVGDVLTFYQERIANEGFLRTATERRSVLELARLVGYSLRPGVAATVYLAYTLEDKQAVPVVIPAGARSQSIPGPGELPQFFETSDTIETRREWNNLQVRLTRPQNITLDTALEAAQIYVDGTSTNVKAGDSLVLGFAEDGVPHFVVRKAGTVEGQFDQKRTLIQFQKIPVAVVTAMKALRAFINGIKGTPAAGSTQGKSILAFADRFLTQVRLGVPADIPFLKTELIRFGTASIADFQPAYNAFLAAVGATPQPAPPVLTTPNEFVPLLLKPQLEQPRSTFHLQRSLATAFQLRTDVHPSLLIKFAPRLKNTLYTAWSNASVSEPDSPLKGVWVFRVETPLFGGSVTNIPTYDSDHELQTQDLWKPWPLTENADEMYLDQAHDAIAPESIVLVDNNGLREIGAPNAVQTVQRTSYGISGKATHLKFPNNWRDDSEENVDALRGVLVFAQSEKLDVIEEPIPDAVFGDAIELDELYNGLTSGRWVVLTGERADISGVSAVTGTELLMVTSLTQDVPQAGDSTHTTLHLATPTAYQYKRDQLKIYGNVVKATHGETKNEILGSGDGSQPLQTFAIKQPPLTFVSAANPSGVDSTLQVYVNNVQWHETDTLADAGPKDREFVTKTDDSDVTSIIFGNGVQGSRLPTGVQNVNAIYRSGIGQPGNVDAGQISMLVTRPLGVRDVINPLTASGGADREDITNARANTPLALVALDRLVSIDDYGFFSRTFAGIGKAEAKRLSDGRQEVVHVTIAGADDIPIDTTSDLYRNLVAALEKYSGSTVAIQVDLRELVILVVSARIKMDPDYLWEDVAARVRAAILLQFGFANRDLGEPALLCELIAAVQKVEGVIYVDVDAFGGIPEKVVDENGNRVLIPMDQIAELVLSLTGAGKSLSKKINQRVDVNQAALQGGSIRPAQLAIFTDAVQDTIVLNQIL